MYSGRPLSCERLCGAGYGDSDDNPGAATGKATRMRMIVRLILSILICLLLPPLLASFISLGGANIGVVELTLFYIMVVGCVIYSWQYSKRKKERRLTREKTDA